MQLRTEHIYREFLRLTRRLSNSQIMMLLAVVVGILAGLGTYLFEILLHGIKSGLIRWFPVDSAIEIGDGYVEAFQTLNGWSAVVYSDATLMPLCDVHNNSGGIGIASVTLTGKLAEDGGEHLI